MKYRTPGKDLTVSAVSLGCMGMTHAYGAPSEEKPMLECVRTLAEQKHATPAQISLAWMIGKKPYIVPIPVELQTFL